jgi:hypothetical protein
MDMQLLQDGIVKFETNRFQYQLNILCHPETSQGQISDITDNKQDADTFQHNGTALRMDKSGRSALGQQYVWALVNWLADYPRLSVVGHSNNDIYRKVPGWLGTRSTEKEKLVRIIIAKLTHDWKSLKIINPGTVNKGLAYFANSVDIWQYTFPKMLDRLLLNIGKIELKTGNLYEISEIGKVAKTNIENEFSIICNLISSGNDIMYGIADKNELIKIWLMASITKTLKAQTTLTRLFSATDQNT